MDEAAAAALVAPNTLSVWSCVKNRTFLIISCLLYLYFLIDGEEG